MCLVPVVFPRLAAAGRAGVDVYLLKWFRTRPIPSEPNLWELFGFWGH